MPEPKTKATAASVAKFIAALKPAERREDCEAIVRLMKRAAKAEPVMWGASIVGFGTRTIEYAGGRTGDWPVLAFSPRKSSLVLYLALGRPEGKALLAKLGKHKAGKGCLYIGKLADVNAAVLKALIEATVAGVKKR
ncbi:MAG: DUF1801 domain-containing protein [Candidatus Eiseniibacteriota bacterium]